MARGERDVPGFAGRPERVEAGREKLDPRATGRRRRAPRGRAPPRCPPSCGAPGGASRRRARSASGSGSTSGSSIQLSRAPRPAGRVQHDARAVDQRAQLRLERGRGDNDARSPPHAATISSPRRRGAATPVMANGARASRARSDDEHERDVRRKLGAPVARGRWLRLGRDVAPRARVVSEARIVGERGARARASPAFRPRRQASSTSRASSDR